MAPKYSLYYTFDKKSLGNRLPGKKALTELAEKIKRADEKTKKAICLLIEEDSRTGNATPGKLPPGVTQKKKSVSIDLSALSPAVVAMIGKVVASALES
jgi:hypothetical protein